MTRRTVVGMRVVNMMLMMGLVIKVVVNIKMDMVLVIVYCNYFQMFVEEK